MSQVKTITLHDGRVMTVEELYPEYHDLSLRSTKSIVDSIPNNTFLGKLSEITEEQILEHNLVEGNNGGQNDTMWKDHRWRTNFFAFQCDTPKDSLLSLLEVNKVDTTKEYVLILKN